jgi:hypothetical protein
MRFFLKATLVASLLAVIGLPVAVVIGLFLALDDQPTLLRAAEVRPEAIARAKRIVERNDPRRMQSGVLRSVVIGGEDLDTAFNYLAHQHARGSAAVRLREGAVSMAASLALPANPFGRYLNLDAEFAEAEGLPQVRSLDVGRLHLPGFVARRLVEWGIAKWSAQAGAAKALAAIKQVSFRDGALMLIYEWDNALPASLTGMLLPAEDEARLKAYQTLLFDLSRSSDRGALPMERLLQAMLLHAGQRGGDAAAENRAVLLSLALFVNGKGLGAVLPATRSWPKPAARHVTLAGRHDFAQHFAVSAALAATAGSPLSDAVGLFKEIDDSNGGSGFSFNDIAADRAGTRFGELATSARAGALKAQKIAPDLTAGQIFPRVDDLPEFMPASEFKRRFGGIGGVEYKRQMAEIERRVAALPVYRD